MSDQHQDSPRPEDALDPHRPVSPEPAAIAPGAAAKDDDGLPEWEPLTPELVEDESIRGDFVMKWAVVLLAFLVASTVIGDTTTLVHVKTGQYLSAHGWLPPANDVFSYTAGERPWVNLAWLFDLFVSGIYAVSGWAGLSLIKALLAALAVGIAVHIYHPGISTWWGSICAALAVLAIQPRLSVEPELMTLVGLASTMYLLFSAQLAQRPHRLWLLVPLFLVWSNLDGRMFMGLYLLGLYAVGNLFGAPKFQRPGARGQLWLVFLLCCAAASVHPFGLKWLASPVTLYGTTYPALRSYVGGPEAGANLEFFPATGKALWLALLGSGVAELLLFVAAITTFVLNFRRLDWGQVFVFAGFSLLAIAGIHEWGAVALVFCVLATLNGQEWYAATYPQVYSIETSALVFSRGGRAVTVLALFALALLAVTGRWRGAADTGLGYGLDPSLAGSIESLQKQLAESFDDRPFNFSPNQGDVLIWLGKRPFIDRRLNVYSATQSDDNIVQRHQDVRNSLRLKRANVKGTGDSLVWKTAFDQFNVTHVLPRLTHAPAPDYFTLFDLLSSPDWELTSLGSATAVFYRKDLSEPEARERLAEFVAEHKQDFAKEAFRDETESAPIRTGWVHPPSFYKTYIWGQDTAIGPETEEGLHLLKLAVAFPSPRTDLVYLAIRKAQLALAKDYNDAMAYAVLGDAYMLLNQFESALVGQQNSAEASRVRYFQAVMALNQSATAEPQNLAVHQRLKLLYRGALKWDLAKREAEICERLMSKNFNPSKAEQKQREDNSDLLDSVTAQIQAIDQDAAKFEEEGHHSIELIDFYAQRGCVLKALEKYDENREALFNRNDFSQLRARLLIEAGQVEEADIVAGMLESTMNLDPSIDWRSPRTLTLLANGQYSKAAQIWLQFATDAEETTLRSLLSGLPVRTIPMSPVPWPVNETREAYNYFLQNPLQTAYLSFNAARVQLEAGQIEQATETFQKSLKANPDSPNRPISAYYVFQMTGDEIELMSPNQEVPVLIEPEAG